METMVTLTYYLQVRDSGELVLRFQQEFKVPTTPGANGASNSTNAGINT